MKTRCYNKNNDHYHRYGGRGIRLCERWRNDFWAFVTDVGPRPSPKHSLDRFPDDNGDYEPGNVRWATAIQQKRFNSPGVRFNFVVVGNELVELDELRKREPSPMPNRAEMLRRLIRKAMAATKPKAKQD